MLKRGHLTKFKPPLGAKLNPEHPLSKGCVGHWLLNEGGSPNFKDLSSYHENASFGTSAPTWSNGLHGDALSLSAGAQYTTVPSYNNVGVLSGATRCSWSFWINQSTVATNRFFQQWDTGTSAWIIQGYTAGTLLFATQLNSSYLEVQNTTTAFVVNRWYHVVVTWVAPNPSGVTIYINGRKEATSVVSGSTVANIPSTTGPVQIGTSVSSSSFVGKIDDLRIWNRVLTPNEVNTLYTNPFVNLDFPKRHILLLPVVINTTVNVSALNIQSAIQTTTIRTVNGGNTNIDICAGGLSLASAAYQVSNPCIVNPVALNISSAVLAASPTISVTLGLFSLNVFSQAQTATFTSGSSVTINVAALNISSTAQTATGPGGGVTVSVSALSITSATQAPSITGNCSVSVSVTSLTSAANAPNVTGTALVSPSVVNVTSATQSPIISGTAIVSVSVRTITSATLAPSVSGAALVSPSVVSVSSSAKTVTVSGNATISPSVLNITSTAQTVTVQASGSITVPVSVLNITSTTQAPSISGSASISVSATSITSTAQTVTVQTGGSVTVNASVLSISSATQVVSVSGTANISPSVVNITGVAQTVIVQGSAIVSPVVLNITSAINAITVSGNAVISASVLSITSLAKTVTPVISPNISVLGITSATLAPSISCGVTVSLSVLNIISAIQTPSVSGSGNATVSVSVLNITSVAQTVTVQGSATASPIAVNITSGVLSPTLKRDYTVDVSTVSVITATPNPSSNNAFITVGVLSIVSAVQAPVVSCGVTIKTIKIVCCLIQDYVEGQIQVRNYTQMSAMIEDYIQIYADIHITNWVVSRVDIKDHVTGQVVLRG